MLKKSISLLSSLVLACLPLSIVSTNAIEKSENRFILSYDYENNKISSVLSIEGDVCIGGFEGTLSYDPNKYTVESTSKNKAEILTNVLPTKGEVVISMAAEQTNLTASSDLLSIEFSCKETPVESDFIFKISDAYMVAENYDTKTVDFSIDQKWKNNSTSTATTTQSTQITTTQTTSTTTSQTTSSKTNVSNDFIINVNENKSDNTVEVSLNVEGNVKFWTAEGKVKIESTGLGVPSLLSSIPDALSSYNDKDKNIYFTIVSSSGGDITDKQNVFSYAFPIEKNDYTISCTGTISDICDQNYNDVNYSISENNNIHPQTITTTSTSIESTTTLQTTTSTTSAIGEETTTNEEINASPYELSKWAENDYYKKTGIEPYRSEYVQNSDGTLSISLYDKDGKVLDVYTIHPKTGIGFNQNGDAVDLPQTGNNSLRPIFIASGSILLILLGFFAIKKSDIVKRKRDT